MSVRSWKVITEFKNHLGQRQSGIVSETRVFTLSQVFVGLYTIVSFNHHRYTLRWKKKLW